MFFKNALKVNENKSAHMPIKTKAFSIISENACF